jgi:hypothetical protein
LFAPVAVNGGHLQVREDSSAAQSEELWDDSRSYRFPNLQPLGAGITAYSRGPNIKLILPRVRIEQRIGWGAEPYWSSGVEWECLSVNDRIDYSQLTRSITINYDHLQVSVVYADRALEFRDARPKSILYVQQIECEMVTRADHPVTDQSFRGFRTSQRQDGQEASRVESI